MKYQVDFFAPIEATKNIMLFYNAKILLGHLFCIILDFWHVWLVNLNDGFHSYIVLVESNKYYKKSKIYPLPVNALYNYKIIKIIFVNMLMQSILPRCGSSKSQN